MAERAHHRFFQAGEAGVAITARERYRVETAARDGVIEVVGIGNPKNGIDGRNWQMYVNSRSSGPGRSVDTYIPVSGECVGFRFERPSTAPKTR